MVKGKVKKIEDQDLAKLAESDHFSHLSYLDLTGNNITNEGLICLVKARSKFSNLKVVLFYRNKTSEDSTEIAAFDQGAYCSSGYSLTSLGKKLLEINPKGEWVARVEKDHGETPDRLNF